MQHLQYGQGFNVFEGHFRLNWRLKSKERGKKHGIGLCLGCDFSDLYSISGIRHSQGRFGVQYPI